MNDTAVVFKKLFRYAGAFRITILLSAVLAAAAAVINLRAYICVYGVAKVLIGSGGDFGAVDPAELSGLGMQAVLYVGMGFGVYGMALLCSHISAYHTVAKVRIRMINYLGELPLGYHLRHPSGVLRKIIEKNTDNLEILIAHHIPDYVQSAVLPVAFLVFMFQYDWRLSVVCLIPIVIGFLFLASMLKGGERGLCKAGTDGGRKYRKRGDRVCPRDLGRKDLRADGGFLSPIPESCEGLCRFYDEVFLFHGKCVQRVHDDHQCGVFLFDPGRYPFV